MPQISDAEFEGLTGVAKKFGKKDPNSLANRVLKTIPKKGAVTADEVFARLEKLEGDDIKKVKNCLNALCYDKVKNAQKEKVTKLERKYNNEGVPFFRKNIDYYGRKAVKGAKEEEVKGAE